MRRRQGRKAKREEKGEKDKTIEYHKPRREERIFFQPSKMKGARKMGHLQCKKKVRPRVIPKKGTETRQKQKNGRGERSRPFEEGKIKKGERQVRGKSCTIYYLNNQEVGKKGRLVWGIAEASIVGKGERQESKS